MIEQNLLAHSDLQAYLKGEQKEKIEKVRKKYQHLELLFDSIDRIIDEVPLPESGDHMQLPGSFEEAEQILADLIAARMSDQDKQQFLWAIYSSANFYEKMIQKTADLTAVMGEELGTELQDIEMRSDDEILAHMRQSVSFEPVKVNISYKLLVKQWQKIKEFLESFDIKSRRWAYATVAVAVIFSSYFGFRFYNTTYQLMQAENLLQQNYKILIADNPRLTGDYQSTPFTGLMADQDEPVTYLDEALNYINKVLNYKSESLQAKQAKAKIFIIKGEYEKAEQLLTAIDDESQNDARVLNTRGVLKFFQGDYQTAILFFEKAISINSDLKESYYNLALVQAKLGDTFPALQSMKYFYRIETDEGWKRAAEQFISDLDSK